MLDKLVPSQFHMDKTAVIDMERSFTFLDLSERIAAIQHCLPKEQGSKVAIYLPNNFDHVAAFWSLVISGMIIIPINIQMTEHEIITLLEQADVCAVITTNQNYNFFNKLSLDIVYVEDIIMDGIGGHPMVHPRDSDAPMVFLCTSGTTGNAKIVQLSQCNIETSVLGFIDKMNYDGETEDIKIVLATLLTTSYGIMMLSVFMIRGVTIVLLPGKFTLETLYKIVEAHRVTHYEGGNLVPQLMNQLKDRPNPYNISSLKYICFGGSKMTADEMKSLTSAYPQIKFCLGYGMSEAAAMISKQQLPGPLKKIESSGTAIKGVEIAVEVDGRIMKEPYVKGEFVIKGANVMLGYYNNKVETDKVLQNGYLYTGDIGYLDEEGYVYISGRIKNIINIRGFNVHPEEIEECLLGSKLVKDCVVYGEIDAHAQEIVCANVMPSDINVTLEEIKEYCASHLAEYKWPKKIQFCDSIMRNVAGKKERIGNTGNKNDFWRV
ncbi:MAG: acyl--CoA ligase [Hungatella sp.]|jgi:long-chain acyl-CoA synthetase|nr:acyl--CoA ligase [Hungatella sp.]